MSLKHLIKVLNKVFVREFYRMNSGFFLLIGTLTFGFMSDIEHIALAQYFVGSFYSLIIPLVIWCLYLAKILYFNDQQLTLEEHRFLYAIQFLTWKEKVAACGVMVFLQFLPAIAYGIFLMLIAWRMAIFPALWIVTVSLVLAWTFGAFSIVRNFQKPWHQKNVSTVKRFLDRHYVRPISQFYAEWLLQKHPFMIAATKVFTCTLLFGVCRLYLHETYDGRLIAMATTACAVANLLVVYHLVIFEHLHIGWIKNLPVRLLTRYGRLLLVLAIFLIPEFVILVKNFPAHFDESSRVLTLFYLLSLSALLLGFLHTRASPVEYFTKQTFWAFIGLILAILFKIPLLAISLAAIAAGWLMFMRNYYSYELSVDQS